MQTDELLKVDGKTRRRAQMLSSAVVGVGTLGSQIALMVGDGPVCLPRMPSLGIDLALDSGNAERAESQEARMITLPAITTENLADIYASLPDGDRIAGLLRNLAALNIVQGTAGQPVVAAAAFGNGNVQVLNEIKPVLEMAFDRYQTATRAEADGPRQLMGKAPVYLCANAAAGVGNGGLIPIAALVRAQVARQGLDNQVGLHATLILPSTNNGVNFEASARLCTSSLAQLQAAVQKPELIMIPSIQGTQRLSRPLFETVTVFGPFNGEVTVSDRDEQSSLAAFDLTMRSAQPGAEQVWVDQRNPNINPHYSSDKVYRAVGYSVIQLDPQRGNQCLVAMVIQSLCRRLVAGSAGATADVVGPQFQAADEALSDTAAPSPLDLVADSMHELRDAKYPLEVIDIVRSARMACEQSIDDYRDQLTARVNLWTGRNEQSLGEQAIRTAAERGHRYTVQKLKAIKTAITAVDSADPQPAETFEDLDTDLLQGLFRRRGPLARASRALVRLMSCGLLGRGDLKKAVLAADRIMPQLTARTVRVAGAALNAARVALREGYQKILQSTINRVERGLEDVNRLVADQQRYIALSDSIPTGVPGIVLPTTNDCRSIMAALLQDQIDAMRLEALLQGSDLRNTFSRAAGDLVASLDLKKQTVAGFLINWPHDHQDLRQLSRERIRESWPFATIDPVAIPGYSPPMIRSVYAKAIEGEEDKRLVDLLLKEDAQRLTQARTLSWQDPLTIVIQQEQRVIALGQLEYVQNLERLSRGISPEIEPHLVPCVADPRELDRFRPQHRRALDAMVTLVRMMATKVVVRNGDNSYGVADPAMHGPLALTGAQGRIDRGLEGAMSRLDADPLLCGRLDELWQKRLAADGREKIACMLLELIDHPEKYVRGNAQGRLIQTAGKQVLQLLPGCTSIEQARRMVGTVQAVSPPEVTLDPPSKGEKPSPEARNSNHRNGTNGRLKSQSERMS